MDYQKKLEELLDRYIEENNNRRNLYNKNLALKDMYNELLKLLNSDINDIRENKLVIDILLDTIYENNIYNSELTQILLNNNDNQVKNLLNRFNKRINDDYQTVLANINTLVEQFKNNQNLLSSAQFVRGRLKRNIAINENTFDINNVKKIINYFDLAGIITDKEELLLINEIETYNRKVSLNQALNTQEKEYFENLYNEIPNILNSGFQKHDEIEVSENRKTTLNKFIKEIEDYINYLDNDNLDEVLENYQNYNINMNEYNYIIVKVLDNLLNELIDSYKLLSDKEIFNNRSFRLETVKNYYKLLDKYIYLRNYYEKITSYHTEEELEEINDDTNKQEELENSKTLIYSHSTINPTNVKILTDMKNIPFEYYDKIGDLLTRFKNGSVSQKEFKTLSGYTKYKELKDDQVRILLVHIKDNIYCVIGAFVKKVDLDLTSYKTMFNRDITDIQDENLQKELNIAEYTEKELTKLISEKKRKGTR